MKEIESSGFLKNGLMEKLPFLEEVYQETIALDRPFQEIAALFADDPGTVLLLSGSDFDCSRYNILAVKPWLEIVSKNKSISIKYQKQALIMTAMYLWQPLQGPIPTDLKCSSKKACTLLHIPIQGSHPLQIIKP